jgi:hypothetical protein
MRLEGYAAIEFAQANNLTLNKYADPIEDAREGLTPEEATDVAREDERLIWIDVPLQQTAKEHIAEYARTWAARADDADWWLPACFSEDSPNMRAALIEELGNPQPSGYMSEHFGWPIDPEYYGLENDAA